jgi:hypothetical protein
MPHRNKTKRPSSMKLVNLEQGMPTVPLAVSLLGDALRIARHEGYTAIKLIHGYGSTGKGGDIRLAVQKILAQQAAAGEIRAFIAGEDWRISNESTWGLLQSCPELKKDSDLGRANRGISIVVL